MVDRIRAMRRPSYSHRDVILRLARLQFDGGGHEVAAKMTPAQIAEAQRMAREWKRLGAPGRAALSARWANVRLQGKIFCSAYRVRWRSL